MGPGREASVPGWDWGDPGRRTQDKDDHRAGPTASHLSARGRLRQEDCWQCEACWAAVSRSPQQGHESHTAAWSLKSETLQRAQGPKRAGLGRPSPRDRGADGGPRPPPRPSSTPGTSARGPGPSGRSHLEFQVPAVVRAQGPEPSARRCPGFRGSERVYSCRGRPASSPEIPLPTQRRPREGK